jgi:hypothetical protein
MSGNPAWDFVGDILGQSGSFFSSWRKKLPDGRSCPSW